MTKTKEKRKDKRTLAALVLLLISIIIIIGITLAFFTDMVTETFGGTYGNVRIDASLTPGKQYYTVRNVFKSQDFDADNINPGDYIVLDFDIENVGVKSAWVKAEIGDISYELDDTTGWNEVDSELTGELFTLYAIPTAVLENAGEPLEGIDKTNAIEDYIENTLMEGSGVEASDSDAVVLYGEKEEDDSEINAVNMVYVLYFNKAADNVYQNASVSLSLVVKALQYRHSEGIEWDEVKEAVIEVGP